VQLEVGVTPGEIKTKTPRISRICKEFSIMYWGRWTGLRLALLLNFGTRSLQLKCIIRQAF
jgi:hypothetical protein